MARTPRRRTSQTPAWAWSVAPDGDGGRDEECGPDRRPDPPIRPTRTSAERTDPDPGKHRPRPAARARPRRRRRRARPSSPAPATAPRPARGSRSPRTATATSPAASGARGPGLEGERSWSGAWPLPDLHQLDVEDQDRVRRDSFPGTRAAVRQRGRNDQLPAAPGPHARTPSSQPGITAPAPSGTRTAPRDRGSCRTCGRWPASRCTGPAPGARTRPAARRRAEIAVEEAARPRDHRRQLDVERGGIHQGGRVAGDRRSAGHRCGRSRPGPAPAPAGAASGKRVMVRWGEWFGKIIPPAAPSKARRVPAAGPGPSVGSRAAS